MTGNLEIWNRFADIDPKFTKPITGKPYKGTSPNPHYIIRCLTEIFGPVGRGFGWSVEAEGFEPLGDEVLHWCRIHFWHGDGKGFQSYGQTKAYMKTKNGYMADEDAPKKSLTDAITKAAAQVGIGANIFLGRWDDNKYVEGVNAEYREAENPFDAQKERNRLKGALEKQTVRTNLERLWKQDSFVGVYDKLPEPMQLELRKVYNDKFNTLTPPDPAGQDSAPIQNAEQYQ